MSEPIGEVTERRGSDQQQVAIGLIATGTNDDAVARAILRAMANDYAVFVTYTTETRPAILEELTSSAVTIISPPEIELGGQQTAKERLSVATEAAGQSQFLYIGDASTPIDYEQSLQDAESFVINGVPLEPEAGCDHLVAIPAYNEAESIVSVVEDAKPYADDVVVIDDGSRDETVAKAESAGASVIRHEYNQGYGAALQTAFETAAEREVEYLVIIDGDGQHDTADIPRVTDHVSDGDANVAIASRFAGEQRSDIPLYRRFGLQVVNVLTNLSMGAISPRSWIGDTQSGFRAYDRRSIELLAETDAIGDDMDASVDILYQSVSYNPYHSISQPGSFPRS